MKKNIYNKNEKQIFNDVIKDIKELKKNNHYTFPENQQFYYNICDTIILAIKKTIK